MIGATFITTYTMTYAIARAKGDSHKEAQSAAQDSINPLNGKKFMSVQIGQTWYGVGGFIRSLMGLQMKLLEASYELTRGNYKPWKGFLSFDQFENPWLMQMRNRGAPALGFGGAFLEGVTATIGTPVDIAPYDVIDNMWDAGLEMGASFLPFAFQGIVDGEGATSMWGLLGARTSEVTLTDATVYLARKSMDLDIETTRDMPESWLKRDVFYPLVEAQYGYVARANNSKLGLFLKRKGVIDGEFEDLITKEWAAGHSDYEMLGIYFDEKNLKNARIEEIKLALGVNDMEVKPRDPIAQALKQWNAIWESKEVVDAVKNDRWDIIEAKRDALLQKLNPAQQAAVKRAGGGIHREIFALLKPESQMRYLDIFNARKAYLIKNTSNPDHVKTLVMYLADGMFPKIDAPRGITPESVGTGEKLYPGSVNQGVRLYPETVGQGIRLSP